MLQTASVIYIDTEKKFSSRRVVEMAKAHWPQHFQTQVDSLYMVILYWQLNLCDMVITALQVHAHSNSTHGSAYKRQHP